VQPVLDGISATLAERVRPSPMAAAEWCQHVHQSPDLGFHVQVLDTGIGVVADRDREDVHHRLHLSRGRLRVAGRICFLVCSARLSSFATVCHPPVLPEADSTVVSVGRLAVITAAVDLRRHCHDELGNLGGAAAVDMDTVQARWPGISRSDDAVVGAYETRCVNLQSSGDIDDAASSVSDSIGTRDADHEWLACINYVGKIQAKLTRALPRACPPVRQHILNDQDRLTGRTNRTMGLRKWHGRQFWQLCGFAWHRTVASHVHAIHAGSPRPQCVTVTRHAPGLYCQSLNSRLGGAYNLHMARQ
jgi:hypothetical protein